MSARTHMTGRGAPRIVMAVAGTSETFPRKRLVQDFTSRFRGDASHAALRTRAGRIDVSAQSAARGRVRCRARRRAEGFSPRGMIAGSGPDSVPRRLLRRPGRATGRVPETAGRQPEDAINRPGTGRPPCTACGTPAGSSSPPGRPALLLWACWWPRIVMPRCGGRALAYARDTAGALAPPAVAGSARPRFRRAAPCRPGSDYHAGHVRRGRQGHRQPAGGYVRGVRVVRDAPPSRLRRPDDRTAPGAGSARGDRGGPSWPRPTAQPG